MNRPQTFAQRRVVATWERPAGGTHGKPGRDPRQAGAGPTASRGSPRRPVQRLSTCGERPECGMRSGECGISEKNGSAGATRTDDPSVSARVARGGLTSVICYSLLALLMSRGNRTFAGREGPRPATPYLRLLSSENQEPGADPVAVVGRQHWRAALDRELTSGPVRRGGSKTPGTPRNPPRRTREPGDLLGVRRGGPVREGQ